MRCVTCQGRVRARGSQSAMLSLGADQLAALLRGAASSQSCRRAMPFKAMVIGEFNSGKTSLINSLLGEPHLPTSVVANTTVVTVIGYAARPRLAIEGFDRTRVAVDWDLISCLPPQTARRLHVGLPLVALKSLQFIDTPGFATGDEIRDQRTFRASTRADVIIWCTPAIQAWKASEQHTWFALSERARRTGILAITFADALASPAEATRLFTRLNAEAGPYFRAIVMVKGARFSRAWTEQDLTRP